MQDQLLEEKLMSFGLTILEADIYLFLQNKNPQSILSISKSLNIPRTTIYDSIEKLNEKGLIETIIKGKSTEVKAYAPTILEDIINVKKNEITDLEENLVFLKSNLKNISQKQAKTEVRYYHGIKGIKQMLWNTLEGEKQMGYTIAGRREIVGDKFYSDFANEFKKRQIIDKVIVNPSERTLEHLRNYTIKGNDQASIKLIKYLPKETFYVSGDVAIYKNVFASMYWTKGEIVGIEIENEELVKTQKSIFKILWKQAKPVIELL